MSERFIPPSGYVNVAALCPVTHALGPGSRAAVWVQGCPFRCEGCLAPAWLPFVQARLWPAEALARQLLEDNRIEGLTISGGEPFAQAGALAQFIAAARRIREINVICFTGFMLEDLHPDIDLGVGRLLDETDVLIDGPYVVALDDGKGLRGSSNQRIHHLTGRLVSSGFDFVGGPRKVEVHVRATEILLAGVPPPGFRRDVRESVATTLDCQPGTTNRRLRK